MQCSERRLCTDHGLLLLLAELLCQSIMIQPIEALIELRQKGPRVRERPRSHATQSLYAYTNADPVCVFPLTSTNLVLK